ncbi:unnamed protein product [Rotaria sp. Silwood2]|nr:unnamed protein product [Rotaria sp. Silwood2]
MFVLINFAGGFLGGFRIEVFSLCISRLNHGTQIMSSIVVNNIAQYIDALVRFIDTLIMMMKLNIHLTIVCLIGAALILIVVKISSNAHRRISEKVQDSSAGTFEIAGETIQTIRSFRNDDEELKILFYNHIKFHE